MTAASIPPGGFCTINQQVTTTQDATNTTAAPVSTNGGTRQCGNGISESSSGPLQVSKQFSVNSITRGSAFQMTITLTNPNAIAVTGAGFTDTYPTAPQIANTATPGVVNSCGGNVTAAASGLSLVLANGVVPANGNCAITVNVQFTAGATPRDTTVTNSTGPVTTANAGTSPGDSATVSERNGLRAVVLTKSFLTNPILPGAATTLRFSIFNPGTAGAANIAFTDTLPTNLTATNGTINNACVAGGTLTVSGGNLITFATGATLLAAGITCTIDLTTVTSSTPGVYMNRTGQITWNSGANSGNYAEDDLTVYYPPTISKSFSDTTIASGGMTAMTIRLGNQNAFTISTTAAMTDTLPVTPGNMTDSQRHGRQQYLPLHPRRSDRRGAQCR